MTGGFSYGGTLATALGLTLLRGPLPGMPSLRERLSAIEGKHGLYDFGTEYGAKELSLRCSLQGTSSADLWARAGTLAQTFDPRGTYADLIFDHETDRYQLARLANAPQLDPISRTEAFVNLDFRCKDAFAYAVTQSSASHIITASPQGATPSVGGNAPAVPLFEMVCGSAVSGGTVGIATADQSLSWAGTLALGDVLSIQASDWTCRRNGTVIMDNVSGEFPTLRGGTANAISYSGFRGTVALTWRDRWL